MSTKWRPEGWKNLYKDKPAYYIGGHPYYSTSPALPDAFEAGADAMLEMLKKGGGIVKDGELKNAVGLFLEDGIAKALNLNGKLIFIPDDKEKE